MRQSNGIQVERVQVIAHRGTAGYAPENTMASFERAIEMNADYLELDIQLSKDNELVVIHDSTVDRTTNGSGAVKDFTLEELQSLDSGSWFNEKFEGQRIPTLGEVLAVCRGKIGVLIETKWPYLYSGLEQKLADELASYHMHLPTERVIVQSFDQNSVKRFHAIMPQIPIGVLVEDEAILAEDKLTELAEYVAYVNPALELVTGEAIERIHSRGMKIFPWTVRSRNVIQPLLKLGVDGVITDYPDYLSQE
ncbi:glycerophosphodiester phosphodiesterase [Paenibacillus endoradicis]|uniref:glycerophosphodiester phosphodiesterase n=1 Tax=Paenibacillus endoradicis TaxID=2972487 RepID=UPI002158BE82|nr:glycerophosphodiester phosphodiesterase family protein [Paenibacillus endoradicis]MCR8658571.1 glycerophosphodiester phosphodiesterase [Paenibacillus endoradicis]